MYKATEIKLQITRRCCWFVAGKFFLVSCGHDTRCHFRLEVCDCISEPTKEEKLLILHYLDSFCSRQKRAFLQSFMRKSRDLLLQKHQFNDPDTKYSETHTPCNMTWSPEEISGEFSLDIERNFASFILF